MQGTIQVLGFTFYLYFPLSLPVSAVQKNYRKWSIFDRVTVKYWLSLLCTRAQACVTLVCVTLELRHAIRTISLQLHAALTHNHNTTNIDSDYPETPTNTDCYHVLLWSTAYIPLTMMWSTGYEMCQWMHSAYIPLTMMWSTGYEMCQWMHSWNYQYVLWNVLSVP